MGNNCSLSHPQSSFGDNSTTVKLQNSSLQESYKLEVYIDWKPEQINKWNKNPSMATTVAISGSENGEKFVSTSVWYLNYGLSKPGHVQREKSARTPLVPDFCFLPIVEVHERIPFPREGNVERPDKLLHEEPTATHWYVQTHPRQDLHPHSRSWDWQTASGQCLCAFPLGTLLLPKTWGSDSPCSPGPSSSRAAGTGRPVPCLPAPPVDGTHLPGPSAEVGSGKLPTQRPPLPHQRQPLNTPLFPDRRGREAAITGGITICKNGWLLQWGRNFCLLSFPACLNTAAGFQQQKDHDWHCKQEFGSSWAAQNLKGFEFSPVEELCGLRVSREQLQQKQLGQRSWDSRSGQLLCSWARAQHWHTQQELRNLCFSWESWQLFKGEGKNHYEPQDNSHESWFSFSVCLILDRLGLMICCDFRFCKCMQVNLQVICFLLALIFKAWFCLGFCWEEN